MPAWLECGQSLPWRGNAARACRVGKGNQAIGVADVECIVQHRHAERLVQPLQEHLLDFGHPVAIRVAQQRDAVCAGPRGAGAFHRADHGVVKDVPHDLSGLVRGLGDEYVAIGQYVDPSRMLQTGRERIDFKAWRRDRRLSLRTSPWAVGILSVGILPCGLASGIVGAAAPRRLGRALRQLP